jgi:hypothetical protein
MMRKTLAAIGIALGVSVSVSFVAHPANAATSDAIAQALVSATLGSLGLDDVSQELSQELTGQLADAVEAGVIDPTISAQIASLMENPALISGLADVFKAHCELQVSAWSASALSRNDSGNSSDEDPDGLDPSDESVNEEGSLDDGLDEDGSDGGISDEDSSDDSPEGGSGSGPRDENSDEDSDSGNSDNEDEKDEGEGEDEDSGRVDDDAYSLPGNEFVVPTRTRAAQV